MPGSYFCSAKRRHKRRCRLSSRAPVKGCFIPYTSCPSATLMLTVEIRLRRLHKGCCCPHLSVARVEIVYNPPRLKTTLCWNSCHSNSLRGVSWALHQEFPPSVLISTCTISSHAQARPMTVIVCPLAKAAPGRGPQ
jgi:hypothetical protein